MVEVTPLGGAQEIGASSVLVRVQDLAAVIDFGARPKREGVEAYPDLSLLLSLADSVAAIVVTHAHYDHIGGLPILHRHFPEARVFATAPTLQIARTLLLDSLSIQERDFDRDPDYSALELRSLFRAFTPVDFGQPVLIASSGRAAITLRCYRAGHILGAMVPVLDIADFVHGRSCRIVGPGDISDFAQPTIRGLDADSLTGLTPDLVLVEGTYGDSEHDDLRLQEARFVKTVADVVRAGGRVVIPAFAVGRSQNVALILRSAILHPEFYREILGDPAFEFPRVPIYVDGMCREVADHYDAFRPLLNSEYRKWAGGDGRHVFFDDAKLVRRVDNVAKREQIEADRSPWVAISSSGMLVGGPVLRYIRAVASDPTSAILLTGYQDEESPGGALVRFGEVGPDRPARITVDDQEVVISCPVHQYRLSAHADARGIERYCRILAPRSIGLVHGEPESLTALAERLRRSFSETNGEAPDVFIAETGRTIVLEGRPGIEGFVSSAIAHPAIHRATDAVRLTGATTFGERVVPAGSTLAVSTSLRNGMRAAWTPADVARADVLVHAHRPIGQSEEERLREGLLRAVGLGWNEHSSGRYHRSFVPDPLPANKGISLARRADEERQAFLVRRRVSIPPQEWQRIERADIRPGDLVLRAHGEFIEPVVILERISFGFRCLGPEGEVDVSAVDILAVVAEWRVCSREYPWDGAAFLRRLADVLADLAPHDDLMARMRDGRIDVRAASRRIWDGVATGDIDPQVASLAILIMTIPGLLSGLTLAQIVQHLEEDEKNPSPELVATLDLLVSLGHLERRTSDDGKPLYVWAGPRRRGSEEADRLLEAIAGPQLARQIRLAYRQAVEVRRLRARALVEAALRRRERSASRARPHRSAVGSE